MKVLSLTEPWATLIKKNMKKNNYQEYICGQYEEGRYAWILENIQVLDNPIKVKGHLSIWNYEEE